jgi:hypothetical protein
MTPPSHSALAEVRGHALVAYQPNRMIHTLKMRNEAEPRTQARRGWAEIGN